MRGRILGSKNKTVNAYKRKWCPRGHDKDAVGRRPRGTCATCANWANRVSRQDPSVLQRHKNTNREYWWRTMGIKNPDGSVFRVPDYARLFAEQNGRCRICISDKSSKAVFDVDHNHTTGFVRGLLCHGCNIKVGAHESPLASAIKKYLGETF